MTAPAQRTRLRGIPQTTLKYIMIIRQSTMHFRTVIGSALRGFAFFVVASTMMTAQSSLDPSYPVQMGVYGMSGSNFQPTSNLYMLSGFPRPMTPFGSGTGDHVMFGGEVSAPMQTLFGVQPSSDGELWGGIRFGFDVFNGNMTATEPTTIIVNGVPTAGVFRTTLASRFAAYSAEPFLNFNPVAVPRLQLRIGAKVANMYTSTFTQTERIEGSSTATFVGSGPERTVYSSSIPNVNRMQVALTGGVGYSFPVGRRFAFIPEVSYQFPVNGLTKDQTWAVHFLRVGASLQVTLPTSKKVIRDTTIQRDTILKFEVGLDREIVELLRRSANRTATDLDNTRYEYVTISERYVNRLPKSRQPNAARVNLFVNKYTPDSSVVNVKVLRCEEVVWNNFTPILNYVFFDSASSTISGRYRQLLKNDISKFAIQKYLTPLETYYEVLNITGSRMRADNSLTIELNGCVSEKEVATVPDYKALGVRRAEAVARYLQEAWDIPSSRIKVRGGSPPQRASRERTHEGVEENQRVEISSTQPDFSAPLMFKDTVNQADVTRLRLDIDVEPGAEIESWSILATQGDKTILGLHGRGAPDKVMEVELDPKQLRRLAKVAESIVTFTLIVDQKGVGDVRVSVDIPVTLVLIQNITLSRRPEIDKYTMMLFDFDKDLISDADMQLVKRARARIDSLSKVTIIGSSDLSGSSEYNLALAERRARRMKDALGIVNAEYRGELLSASDAQTSTPEGRFHGRTVRILVHRTVPTKDD